MRNAANKQTDADENITLMDVVRIVESFTTPRIHAISDTRVLLLAVVMSVAIVQGVALMFWHNVNFVVSRHDRNANSNFNVRTSQCSDLTDMCF